MTIGNSQAGMYRCFLKLFVTWSREERLLRLGRIVWRRGELMNGGYTAKFSFGLMPRLFRVKREWWGLLVVMFGVRLHYQRSYGGYIV